MRALYLSLVWLSRYVPLRLCLKPIQARSVTMITGCAHIRVYRVVFFFSPASTISEFGLLSVIAFSLHIGMCIPNVTLESIRAALLILVAAIGMRRTGDVAYDVRPARDGARARKSAYGATTRS